MRFPSVVDRFLKVLEGPRRVCYKFERKVNRLQKPTRGFDVAQRAPETLHNCYVPGGALSRGAAPPLLANSRRVDQMARQPPKAELASAVKAACSRVADEVPSIRAHVTDFLVCVGGTEAK